MRLSTLNLGISNRQPMDVNEYKKDLLIADFEQSMEMLRHYDNFHWDVTKFCFSQICVIIGACWYVHEQNASKHYFDIFGLNVQLNAILLLLSSLFTMLCILALLQNRKYFCKVSHYINEHRNNALNENIFGFCDNSNIWRDYTLPLIFDWKSTQLVSVYLLSICFIALYIIAIYLFLGSVIWLFSLVSLTGIIAFGILTWRILK